MKMSDLNLLVPAPDPPVNDAMRWVTITQETPLRVRFDGEADPLPVDVIDLVGGLVVNDRVWTVTHAGQVYLIGKRGGGGGGGGGEVTAATAKARTTSPLTSASSSWTTYPMTEIVHNSDPESFELASPGIRVKVAGWYVIVAMAEDDNLSSQRRLVAVQINGAGQIDWTDPGTNTGYYKQQHLQVTHLNAGDTVGVAVYSMSNAVTWNAANVQIFALGGARGEPGADGQPGAPGLPGEMAGSSVMKLNSTGTMAVPASVWTTYPTPDVVLDKNDGSYELSGGGIKILTEGDYMVLAFAAHNSAVSTRRIAGFMINGAANQGIDPVSAAGTGIFAQSSVQVFHFVPGDVVTVGVYSQTAQTFNQAILTIYRVGVGPKGDKGDTGDSNIRPHTASIAGITVAAQATYTKGWADFGIGSLGADSLVSMVIYNGGSSSPLILGGYSASGVNLRNVGTASFTAGSTATCTIWVKDP